MDTSAHNSGTQDVKGFGFDEPKDEGGMGVLRCSPYFPSTLGGELLPSEGVLEEIYEEDLIAA